MTKRGDQPDDHARLRPAHEPRQPRGARHPLVVGAAATCARPPGAAGASRSAPIGHLRSNSGTGGAGGGAPASGPDLAQRVPSLDSVCTASAFSGVSMKSGPV